jgi:hypothetical protein
MSKPKYVNRKTFDRNTEILNAYREKYKQEQAEEEKQDKQRDSVFNKVTDNFHSNMLGFEPTKKYDFLSGSNKPAAKSNLFGVNPFKEPLNLDGDYFKSSNTTKWTGGDLASNQLNNMQPIKFSSDSGLNPVEKFVKTTGQNVYNTVKDFKPPTLGEAWDYIRGGDVDIRDAHLRGAFNDFASGTAETATFGATKVLDDKLRTLGKQKPLERKGLSYDIGRLTGLVLGGGLASKLALKAGNAVMPTLMNSTKLLPKIVGGAIAEGAGGAAYGGLESAVKGVTGQEQLNLSRPLEYGVFGSAIGGALPVLGKGAKFVADKLKNKNTIDDANKLILNESDVERQIFDEVKAATPKNKILNYDGSNFKPKFSMPNANLGDELAETQIPKFAPEIAPEPVTKQAYSEEVQKNINNINKTYAELFGEKLPRSLSEQKSFEIRQAIQADNLISVDGGLTAKELTNKIKNLKKNYIGKEVVTPDGEGIVKGNAYGKVNVQFSDGTSKIYESKLIQPKINIDDVIAKQKEELRMSQTAPITPKTVTEISSDIAPQINEVPQYTAPATNRPLNTINPNRQQVQSNIKTNTLENVKWVETPEQRKIIDDLDLVFGRQTNKESRQLAADALNSDYEGTYNKLLTRGIDSAEDVVAAGQLTRDFIRANNAEEVNRLLKSIRPDATKAGQISQAFAEWKPQSLEGIMFKDAKLARNYEKLISEQMPEKYKKITSEVKATTEQIAKAIKEEMKDGIKINLQLFAESVEKRVAQAIKLPKGYVKKIIEMTASVNKETNTFNFSKDDIANFVKQKYGIPTMTKSDIEEMMSLWTEAQKHADSPESYKYRELMYKLGNVVPGKMKPTWGNKLRSLQAWNLFFNPTTLEKIAFGNALGLITRHAKSIPEAMLDSTIGLATGKRYKTLSNPWTEAKGVGRRTVELIKDFKNDVDTNMFNNTFEYNMASPWKNKGMKFIDKTSKLAFGLVENTVKQGVYDDAINQLIKLANINGRKQAKKLGEKFVEITKPTEEMVQEAKTVAEKLTMAHDNALTKGLNSFRRGINDLTNIPLEKAKEYVTGNKMTDRGEFGLGNLVLPVLRTPANMAIWVAEHVPVLNTKTISGVLKVIRKDPTAQKDIVEGIVNSMLSGTIGYGTYKAAEAGLAYGSPDKDKDARNFNESRGQQPNSFTLGKKNITNDWMQPFSSFANFGAEFGQGKKNKQPLEAAVNSYLKQSFLQSLSNMMGGGRNPNNQAENIQETLLNTANQAVPFSSTVNMLGKLTDDYKRDTKGKNVYDEAFNKLKARLPLARQTLPAQMDAEGNLIKEANNLQTLFSPSKIKDVESKSPVKDELDRIYKNSGEVKQFTPTIQDKKTIKGNNIKFSKDEVLYLQKSLSTKLNNEFTKIMNADKYKELSDEERAKQLANIIESTKTKTLNEEILKKGFSPKTGKAP